MMVYMSDLGTTDLHMIPLGLDAWIKLFEAGIWWDYTLFKY